MSEELTLEDIEMLREAQERLRDRVGAVAAPSPQGPVAFLSVAHASKATQAAHRCQGACGGTVKRRGGWCPKCAEDGRRRARELEVDQARQSISPGGALAWCRAGNPKYAEATAKAAATAPPELLRIVTHAAWTRDTGSALIIGPTDFGKTRMLAAIGHRVLDYAVKVGWSQPDMMRFAQGVRYISALDIGEARAQTRWQEPECIREAKSATLLLLDEVGWEDARFDPNAIRNILRARFDPVWKPTIVASGMTYKELEKRYGEPTVRMVTCKGVLLDMHPKKAA